MFERPSIYLIDFKWYFLSAPHHRTYPCMLVRFKYMTFSYLLAFLKCSLSNNLDYKNAEWKYGNHQMGWTRMGMSDKFPLFFWLMTRNFLNLVARVTGSVFSNIVRMWCICMCQLANCYYICLQVCCFSSSMILPNFVLHDKPTN